MELVKKNKFLWSFSKVKKSQRSLRKIQHFKFGLKKAKLATRTVLLVLVAAFVD